MKYLLLMNPLSRGKKGQKLWKHFFAELDRQGVERDTFIFSTIDEAFEKAKNLDTSIYQGVIAAGGDGTIRAAAAGVLANPDPEIKFGVLYSGTSPDFCKHYRSPITPAAAVGTIVQGKICETPFLTADNDPFFCSCNPGFGAEVARKANKFRPHLGDTAGTLAALAGALLRNCKYDFTLNGTPLKNVNHLLITRNPFIAGNLKIQIPALKEDEYILWYLQDISRMQWPRVLYSLYSGRPCGKWQILSGETTLECTSHPHCEVEYDGDPHTFLPVKFNIPPRKLKLIVMEEEAD